MSRPVRRVLSPRTVTGAAVAAIHLRRTLPHASSDLPAGIGRAALGRLLSGLAPGGVYRAAPVTRHAGGLLHHPFTLTAAARRPRRRSTFCGTFPRVTPGGCYPPPCSVEPGRSSSPRRVPRPPGRLIRTHESSRSHSRAVPGCPSRAPHRGPANGAPRSACRGRCGTRPTPRSVPPPRCRSPRR